MAVELACRSGRNFATALKVIRLASRSHRTATFRLFQEDHDHANDSMMVTLMKFTPFLPFSFPSSYFLLTLLLLLF